VVGPLPRHGWTARPHPPRADSRQPDIQRNGNGDQIHVWVNWVHQNNARHAENAQRQKSFIARYK
jgi:hypothetical protein